GRIPEGATATDMVLAITKLLRDYGVVGKFVEVFGEGLDYLTVTDRATISNMSPEFGCTVAYFPIDEQTLEYMRRTNRPEEQVNLVERYCKENLLWRTGEDEIIYSDVLELDLSTLEPTVSGPKRPQDKILVRELHDKCSHLLEKEYSRNYVPIKQRQEQAWLSEGGSGTEFTYQSLKHIDDVAVETDDIHSVRIKVKNKEYILGDGSIVIAAIT